VKGENVHGKLHVTFSNISNRFRLSKSQRNKWLQALCPDPFSCDLTCKTDIKFDRGAIVVKEAGGYYLNSQEYLEQMNMSL